MSEERLEEIGKNVTGILNMDSGEVDSVDLPLLDFTWLYKYAKEQTKRVQEFESEYEVRQVFYLEEHIERLEKENKRYKEAWIKAKKEAKEYGAGRADENISDDDKEEAYREGAEDMYGDFVDEYERALKGDSVG